MRNVYENVPSNQIAKQKRYLYGALINILYLYDDKRGLVPIVESNELNYNYKNICDYKEKK